MKTYLRIAAITATVLACWSATAQYTFNAEIQISGKCFGTGSSMAENNLRQWVNSMNAMLKSIQLTREECIAMNRQMAGEAATMSFAEYGCVIKIRVTPCVCTGGVTEVTPGPDQGGSFNSTNPGNEVRDWASDVDARRAALDRKAPLSPATGTGDKKFDDALQRGMDAFNQGNKVDMPKDFELMANMDNVRRYMEMTDDLAARYIKSPDPAHLTEWFHMEFKQTSGFDIDELTHKLPSELTDAERQAMLDYQAFRRLLADKTITQIEEFRQSIARSEETRAYEMAVLSEDCYGDSEHKYLDGTNYRTVSATDFATDNPVHAWLELINKCNQYPGFHAQPYINSVTGELTVAFEGSNMHPIDNWDDFKADWSGCNFKQGMGGIPEQYVLAMIIADAVPEGVSINFTGHSLGGGLASVAGVVSGTPTYTYNPEGVNGNILDAFEIRGKVETHDYNITAYQANNDPLTSMQEGTGKVIAEGIITGSIITEAVERSDIETGTVVSNHIRNEIDNGNILAPAIGTIVIIESGGGHDRLAMVQYFGASYDYGQSVYTAWQNSFHQAGYGHEQQTQSSINIIWK